MVILTGRRAVEEKMALLPSLTPFYSILFCSMKSVCDWTCPTACPTIGCILSLSLLFLEECQYSVRLMKRLTMLLFAALLEGGRGMRWRTPEGRKADASLKALVQRRRRVRLR